MHVRLLVTAAAIVLGIGAANAQSSPSSTSSTGTAGQQSAQVPQEIKQKLSADGFTNVQVVPGSYLVSAKDKNGDPVMMVIGPHSMTILTELPKSNSSTTGSSTSSSGQSGTSSSSSK
jgi:hypothetical protein